MLDLSNEVMTAIIIASALVVGGFVIGLVIDRIIISRLRKWAEMSEWRFDDVIIGAIHGMPMWVLSLVGANTALPYLPIADATQRKVSTFLIVATIILVVIVVMRLVSGLVAYYANRVIPSSTSLIKNLVNGVIVIVGGLVILQTMGIQITPLITALGVGGLAVALALQDTLANLFAGIHVLAVKQINTGDYVRLDTGDEGFIEDITWRNTTIRMLRNNLIIVPNTKIASAIITNYSLPEKAMSVLVPVGVAYDSDLEKVEDVSREVARQIVKEHEGGYPEFDPLIRFHTFNDFSIDFNVIMRTREFVDQYALTHEFVKALKKRFDEEGIEIPFPIRTVHMKGGGSAE